MKGEDGEQLGKKNPREKEEDFWGKRALENFGQQLGAGRSGKREVFFFLGEEAKAGEQTFRFGYYVFPCIFYFFHISHVFILYDFYSVCWVASFGDYWFHI